MNYSILSKNNEEERARYVWEDGVVKKKYAVISTEEGEWLQSRKVLDASERPIFYDYSQIFFSEQEAYNIT